MEFTLKEQLQNIKDQDYELSSGYNLYEITENMIKNIGNVDPELRDELIYRTFYFWIIKKKYYNKEQLREILKTIFDDNHLFYKIGNKGDDSVFTRAFSVLLVPLILSRHEAEHFLNKQDKKMVTEEVLAYFQQEQDYRGYIENKGWAHAVAHGADALDEIALTEFVTHNELIKILELIKIKVSTKDYVFVNEEDERLVTAVISLISRGIISDFELVDWIKSFRELTIPKTHPEYHHLIINIKSFLRSLYFRMLKEDEHKHFLKDIEETLAEFSRF